MNDPNRQHFEQRPAINKIIVIGSGGAGKSILAQQMGDILGLPVFHLDALFWHPGWIETHKPEWREKQRRLVAQDQWIIDGNYGGTIDLRLAACDTAVFLNFSRWVCLFRIVKRYIQYRNRTRPDMGDGCRERLSLQYVKWVWNYPKANAPRIAKQLADVAAAKTVITLRSPRAVRRFLQDLRRDDDL